MEKDSKKMEMTEEAVAKKIAELENKLKEQENLIYINTWTLKILETFRDELNNFEGKEEEFTSFCYYQPYYLYHSDVQKYFERAARELGFDIRIEQEKDKYSPRYVKLSLMPKPISENDKRSIAHMLFDGIKNLSYEKEEINDKNNDNSYVITVIDGDTNLPRNIKNGRYSLVRIPGDEEILSLHSLGKIKEEYSYIKIYNNILSRTCNALKRADIEYIEELEGYDDKKLELIRNLGSKCIALVIALCKKYSVNVYCSQKKYEREAKIFLDMLEKGLGEEKAKTTHSITEVF